MTSIELKLSHGEKGWTLVEVVVAVVISSIIMGGMVLAYTDAIRDWMGASERLEMFEEGMGAMKLIHAHIRSASNIERPRSYGGRSEAFLRMKIPNHNDLSGNEWISEFYHSVADQSVKYNGSSMEKGAWVNGKRILPFYVPDREPGEGQYISVKRLRFSIPEQYRPTDPINPVFGIILVEMTLESTGGDTLYMSSFMAKRN